MGDEGRTCSRSIKHEILQQARRIVHVEAWCTTDVNVFEVQGPVRAPGQRRRSLSSDQREVHETEAVVDVLQVHGGARAVVGAGVHAFHRPSNTCEVHP